MEQQNLRTWEHKCIQEEPPFCQASCPLHVDVRGMCRLLAEGKAAEARKVLERSMPLAGILGRICNHPCEAYCRRKDVETSIRIHELERHLVLHAPAPPRPPRLPAKGQRVIVLGGGLSGLVVANDLARKGLTVTVRHVAERPGGHLWNMTAEVPEAVLLAEVEGLARLGVRFERIDILDQSAVDAALAESGAVYVALDAAEPRDLTLPERNPVSMAVGPTLFVGGAPGAAFSPMGSALAGRTAALSIDRLFQGASLDAGRDREGPFPSRLYTNIDGVARQEPMAAADPQAGYTADEATAEAGRCLDCQCLECVKVCTYLEKGKGYPKKYAREIYNNLAVIYGVRRANHFINTCSNCGLCAEVCPNDFHMGELCISARQELVAQDHMPPSAHDFALRDLAFNLSEAASLARHAPGATTSDQVFWPGCQLAGSAPDHVLRVYNHLRQRLPGGVGILLTCCGAPAKWAGRPDLLDSTLATLRGHWEALGRPEIICGCSTCLDMLGRHAPEIAARSLWEALLAVGLPDGARALSTEPVAVHDPCTSRYLPQARQAVRSILQAVGQPVEELDLSAERTECCGYGGHMDAVDAPLAREVAGRRVARTGRELLAFCAMCRDQLSRQGTPARHLLEALFPDSPDSGARLAPEPLVRSGPPRSGYADRHENRARLRARLLADVFGEAAPAETRLALQAAPEALGAMDARRILLEDAQTVIRHAEASGRKFVAPDGRFLAGYQPAAVTYWVEYRPDGQGGFQVLRAWSHRMALAERSGGSSQLQRFPEYQPDYAHWRCGVCGKDLELLSTRLEYVGSSFDVELPGCASCGMSLVYEELALGKMLEVEQILEDK